jgi:hypothetical protein
LDKDKKFDISNWFLEAYLFFKNSSFVKFL